QGKTQLTVQSLDTVSKVGQTSLPTITPISLPQQGQSSLEAYEGMRVVLEAESGDLMLTDHSLLGRYGQVTVTSGGRLEQYTESNLPSVSGYEQWLTDAKARSMILDDGNTAQNPDPILFGRNDERLSAENTLRGGDRVADVEGVLDFAFGDWRMQLTEGVNFAGAERPQVPDLAGSRLEVGVLNLQNYFNTLDQTGAKTVTLDGQEHDPRGADNAAEFLRQQDKLVAAINESGAEVMGLLELENNGYGADSAIQSLVNALNADNAARGVQSVRWAFSVPHDEAGNITSAGNDAISTGIIYNSLAVTPAGEAKTHTQGAFAAHNRAPVLQAFEERATGEVFTVVVNHFKSKGSVVNGEYASGDGQGNNSPTRVVAAEELLQWLASDPSGTGDEDVLILGDLNAYTREDPVQALVAGGYHSLVSDHTYAYNGFWGALDHALASSTLADQVTQAAVWHINADEPSALDYNTDYVSPVQAENLYANDPYRSSDHDMILVGLELF
ncbi:MAG: ExeM/NucH family extracellular endonuclease, partial [Marinobacterium sp.]